MAYSAALIDFDGTLADSMPYWLRLPLDTLSRLGLPEPEGFRERISTRPMWEVAGYLSELYPTLTQKGLRDLWDGMMLENYRERILLKDGVRELLGLLRARGVRLILLSATRQPYLNGALEHFDLLREFEAVLTETETGAKHEPETFIRLAQRLGCAPEELLLLEDSPPNLRAARAAGQTTVALYDASKPLWWEEIAAGADAAMLSPADLLPLQKLLDERK